MPVITKLSQKQKDEVSGTILRFQVNLTWSWRFMFAEIKGHAHNDENTFGKYYVKTVSINYHICAKIHLYILVT